MFIEARRPNPPKKYENLLGPVTMKLAFDEIQPKQVQLFQESRYISFAYEFPDQVQVTERLDGLTDSLMTVPSYNGLTCGFVVFDTVTKKLVFCSSFRPDGDRGNYTHLLEDYEAPL